MRRRLEEAPGPAGQGAAAAAASRPWQQQVLPANHQGVRGKCWPGACKLALLFSALSPTTTDLRSNWPTDAAWLPLTLQPR